MKFTYEIFGKKIKSRAAGSFIEFYVMKTNFITLRRLMLKNFLFGNPSYI